ncbi:hypothetical protein QFC21_005022 [Naganishia friedmannii]|uniref:Uncharacterized protein n=1 Tax=Naganishia friedmannii TaxID=89922 RepID=A0ACC2VDV2_9TREE|nr:hypothetical protein QFC21_005022 [Naganishia friedmannii]
MTTSASTSSSSSSTTPATTPYKLVTEWSRFAKKDADSLTVSDVRLGEQQLNELRITYLKGINVVAKLIDTNPHIDTVVAATAVLHLYMELPCVGKLKNFCVPDLTLKSLHLILGALIQNEAGTLLILASLFLDNNLTEWANDDIIDCCAQVLCRAACRSEDQVDRSANPVRTPTKTFILRTGAFQSFVHPTTGTFIENETSRQAMLKHSWFCSLTSQLKRSHDAVIYLPITLNNAHWIAAKLDVSTGIWSFADSMNSSSIPKVYFDSCILLSKMLGISSPQTEPPLRNATFRSGVQVDGHSCGYFALNAIEADVFGTPLASTSTREYQRLRTFWIICQEHAENHGPVVGGRVRSGGGCDVDILANSDLDQFYSPTLSKVGRQLRTLKDRLFPPPPPQAAQPILQETVPPTQFAPQLPVKGMSPDPESFNTPSRNISDYRQVDSTDGSDTEGETDASDTFESDTEYMQIDASDCIDEDRPDRYSLQRHNAMLPLVLEEDRNEDMDAPVDSPYALIRKPTGIPKSAQPFGKFKSKVVTRNQNAIRAEQRPDLWDNFVQRINRVAPAAKTDKKLWPKHVWCPVCREWKPIKAVFQSSCFIKHYEKCIIENPFVSLDDEEPTDQISAVSSGSSLPAKSKKATDKLPPHVNNAVISHSTKSIASIFSMVTKRTADVPQPQPLPRGPCPGLTTSFDPRIAVYLGRTGAGGGGSPTLKVLIARARLQLIDRHRSRSKSPKSTITGPAYNPADLKKMVDLLREKYYKWINHGNLSLVRAATCTGEANRLGHPCDPCRGLRTNKIFTNALKKSPPAGDKVKYTPGYYVRGFLHELAVKYHGLENLFDSDGKQSVMLRLAKMIEDDKSQDNKYEIFRGMSEAIYHTNERRLRGKGTQGLVRNQMFVNTMHSLALMGPYAYRKLHRLFGAPTIRFLRLKRQSLPAFRLGIDPENFDIAARILANDGDTSPLCLSVDDTALVPKLRSLYDTQRKTWHLLGHVSDDGNTAFGADLVFDREEDVRAAIEENVLKKGTKITLTCKVPTQLRGYLLTSNTPGTPSILVAAFAIGAGITADQLFPLMKEVIRQLDRVGLAKRVVSIVSDGAPTETAAHDGMIRSYTLMQTRLPAPSNRFAEIVINYSIIGGTKTVALVDAKHTSKNAMNAQCSGARVLILGDHIVTYSQLLEVIQTSRSPLFKSDVVKSDRQDDQRMERYLSPDTIDYVITNMPGDLGFHVYLYIFGELHSAVQSWTLPHATRIQMLLTTEYFLQGWQTFVEQHPDYGPTQFLSHGFFKIVKRLIRGVIGLILLFKERAEHGQLPLLPWRHMTEALEHYFGTARRFVQEFDIVQFAQLSKKISLLIDLDLRGNAFGGNDESIEEARSRRGYQHTYHMSKDLDVLSLSNYPSESDVPRITLIASNSATDLLCALGMRVEWDLGPARTVNPGAARTVRFSEVEESIWDPENQEDEEDMLDRDDVASERKFQSFLGGFLVDLNPAYNTMLEEMIERASKLETSEKMQETVGEVALAATALEVETEANLEVQLAVRPSEDDDSGFHRPPLDIAHMISLRRLHSSDYSKTARKGRKKPADVPQAITQPEKKVEDTEEACATFAEVQQSRQALHHRMIKQAEQEEDIQTNIVFGGNRQQRYRGKINSQRLETGNETERRVVVRDNRVAKAEGNRLRQFCHWTSQVDFRQAIGKGGVSQTNPLRPLDLVVFVSDGKWVGKGKHRDCVGRISLGIALTMYEQDAPGNPHAHVPEGDSLAKLSFIVVQELKQIASSTFTPFIHDSPTPSYHHLTSCRVIEKVGHIKECPQLGPSSMVTVPRKAYDSLRLWQTQRALLVPCAVSKPGAGSTSAAAMEAIEIEGE